MQNVSFPHMEWAKAHTEHPLEVEPGFSGAARPRGTACAEHCSGEPSLERRIARKYGVSKDRVYLVGGTSLENFVTLAAFCGAPQYVRLFLGAEPRAFRKGVTALRRAAGS